MAERWLPRDPRQREIHRLMLLVGGEPASFFLDACRLMDGDYRLEATTHVVGHLLRELNLVLRDVLRPMVPEEQWPAPGVDDANRKQIDVICDALGIGADDLFRTLWRDYAGPLHEWAHRYSRAAPRPVDDAFREVWTQGQTVVHRLARRIEANYTRALPLVDELAVGPPDPDRLRQEVVHSTLVLERFYGRAGVDWLEPLRADGVFAAPPPLVYEEDGSVGYSRWPQGRFLARVAPAAPEAVVDIALALDTDNPEAHESLLDAALAIDAAEAARLVPKVEQWLETPAQWQLPFKAQELVVHLVAGGESGAALTLLRTLIGAARVERDRFLGAEIVGGVAVQIFPAAGFDGLELLAQLLEANLGDKHDGVHDYSSIWRPHLAGERRRDLRDALVTALRDGAEAVVLSGAAAADVVALLEGHQLAIFRRLALELLLHHPDSELIAARLTDRALFEDANAMPEYEALLTTHFADLGGADQERILAFIEQGPPHGGEDQDYAARWRLRMLGRLPEELPGDWPGRRAELRERYGLPEPERLPEMGWVGPSSPVSRDELSAMSVNEVVELLQSWEPPAGEWRAPSREGLARLLRQLVADNPEPFANEAMAFVDVGPTYAHSLVGGLREAKTNGRSFPWPPVLELALAVLDKPRQIEGRDPSGFDGDDPGWAWTWQDVAYLMGAGFGGDGAFTPEESDLVWQVLARLAEDENPTVELESGEEARPDGAPMLAINSVRGAAFEAVIGYVWWLRSDAPTTERHMPEEARELLDRHLDPGVEPTAAIRSLYGKWFPYLAVADPTWAGENVARIFVAEPERLGRAAWESYLQFNGVWEGAFGKLREQYYRGVEGLTANAEEPTILDDVGSALINHLMTALRYGLLTFADGSNLLERFYELASLERRTEAIESIGRGLVNDEEDTELDAEMAVRLRGLWERRLAAVEAADDENAGEELRGFAWWFASDKFDPAWSLEQLAAVVEAGGRVHPDHLVAERLAALRDDHLAAVLRALELLVESGTRQWFVLGARDEIEAILASGLAAGGAERDRARDITNRLVARGHVNYERLLER